MSCVCFSLKSSNPSGNVLALVDFFQDYWFCLFVAIETLLGGSSSLLNSRSLDKMSSQLVVLERSAVVLSMLWVVELGPGLGFAGENVTLAVSCFTISG